MRAPARHAAMPSPRLPEHAMQWSPALSIGSAPFDAAHRRCINALAQLETAPDHQYLGQLRTLCATLRAGFDEEEAMMENMEFPERTTHCAQHRRVLNALHEVASLAAQRDFTGARALVALLPHWFLFHWVRMDMTLVMAAESVAAGRPLAPPSQRPVRAGLDGRDAC
jgi:hemerythrin